MERNRTKQRTQEERQEKPRDEERDKARDEPPEEDGPPRSKSVRVSTPSGGGGGFSILGWLLLGGLALAVIAVGVYLFLNSPRSPRQPKPVAETGQEKPLAENDARQVLEESPSVLWKQAETLAGQGQHREAVRLLYLAILALLHRQHIIRFEPTRTNGEYVRQVRLSEQAPAELADPFACLTDRFEGAWYGERPCSATDYDACRTVADTIRQMVKGA